jgi:hypothetical protein
MENMHPYSIDFIYSELAENFDINTIDAEMVARDGIFEIETFMKDLGKLYNAVRFYVALEGFLDADNKVADNLYEEGRYFERFKHAHTEIPDEIFTDKTSRKAYDELMNTFVDYIPNFNMKLKFSPLTNRFEFSADVNSVFDIAWYTLARMISEAPALENRNKQDEQPEGILICCRHCGKFLIRKGKRQGFCTSPECQKARKAINQKDFRKRKAVEKAQIAKESGKAKK